MDPFAGMGMALADALSDGLEDGIAKDGSETHDLSQHPVLPGFGLGVMLDTCEGPQPVEWLRAGDLVLTRDHGYQPLLWVGRSRRNDHDIPDPLRIHAGALGKRMPERDLVLSPGHHVLLQSPQVELHFATREVLAPVADIATEAEFDFETSEPDYAYRHIMFAEHELVLAEGVWCESLFPDEAILNTLSQAARPQLSALFLEGMSHIKRARLTLYPGESQVLQPRHAVAARRMAA